MKTGTIRIRPEEAVLIVEIAQALGVTRGAVLRACATIGLHEDLETIRAHLGRHIVGGVVVEGGE